MNAYTSITGGGFQAPAPTYDPNGNTLTLPRPDGSSQSLTWDAQNRLRTASSIHDPQSTISAVYDPLGRLVWTRTTQPNQPATDEVWTWSGWTLLTREVMQGSTLLDTFRYIWGPDLSTSLEGAGGVGGLLAIEHAAGNSTTWNIRHCHYDANGNVIALTTDTGTLSARYRYSPFGELISSEDLDASGWNTRNIHRFSTKPEVAGTGLLYYGYRYYDPVSGRWPSRDPIEEMGGFNLYAFVGNDGVNDWDYLGLLTTLNTPAGASVLLGQIAQGVLTRQEAAAMLGITMSTLALYELYSEAQGLIDHLDRHIANLEDLCDSCGGSPDPNDPNNRDLKGWVKEVKAAIQNLQQKLKRFPNNASKKKPVEEAIKRGKDVLKKCLPE